MGLNPNGNILIFTPTVALHPDPHRYQESLIKIFNQIQAKEMGFGYLPAYRMSWWPAWNMAFDVAFAQGFEYILRFDDDIHQVPDDAIEKLLAADKEVIGGAYPIRYWPYFTAAMNRRNSKSLIEIYLTDDKCLEYVSPKLPEQCQEGETPEIIRADLLGFGLTLIKTEKFKQLTRPIFLGNEEVLDDTYFSQLCLDNDIKQYVHFGVKLTHDFVDYENNLYLFNAGLAKRMGDQLRAQGKTEAPTQEEMKKFTDEQACEASLQDK